MTAAETYEFHPDVFVDITEVIERVAGMIGDLDAVTQRGKKVVSTMVLHGVRDRTLELTGHAERAVTTARRWGEMCGVRFAQAFRSIVRAPQRLW